MTDTEDKILIALSEDEFIEFRCVDECDSHRAAADVLSEDIRRQTQAGNGSLEFFFDGGLPCVRWTGGPEQWADSYVVQAGASSPLFTSIALDGETVMFESNH